MGGIFEFWWSEASKACFGAKVERVHHDSSHPVGTSNIMKTCIEKYLWTPWKPPKTLLSLCHRKKSAHSNKMIGFGETAGNPFKIWLFCCLLSNKWSMENHVRPPSLPTKTRDRVTYPVESGCIHWNIWTFHVFFSQKAWQPRRPYVFAAQSRCNAAASFAHVADAWRDPMPFCCASWVGHFGCFTSWCPEFFDGWWLMAEFRGHKFL